MSSLLALFSFLIMRLPLCHHVPHMNLAAVGGDGHSVTDALIWWAQLASVHNRGIPFQGLVQMIDIRSFCQAGRILDLLIDSIIAGEVNVLKDSRPKRSLETFQARTCTGLANLSTAGTIFVRQVMGWLALHGYTRLGNGCACQMRATEWAEKITNSPKSDLCCLYADSAVFAKALLPSLPGTLDEGERCPSQPMRLQP
jgi:hypothetical protein